MKDADCYRKGEGHKWYSTLADYGCVVTTDWCVNCGEFADSKPHIMLHGERREVTDVETPDELL